MKRLLFASDDERCDRCLALFGGQLGRIPLDQLHQVLRAAEKEDDEADHEP